MKLIIKIFLIFILIQFLTYCSSYSVKKGNYLGYREEVDKGKVIGYGVGIGEVIKPHDGFPYLKIQTVKVNVHPVVKINQYEKILSHDLATDKGFMWLLYGDALGFISGLIQYEGKDENSGAKSFLKSLEWGAGGFILGSIWGKFQTVSTISKKPFEEKTDIQVGKKNGESIGVLPKQKITLYFPSLGQTLVAESNAEGYATFNLAKELYINEWPIENSSLEVEIKTVDSQKEIQINPNFFLPSYLKVTKYFDNIRSGPGINFPVIAHCSIGEKYKILDRKGNWFKVQYQTGNAWMHKSLGKIVKGSTYQFNPEKPPKLLAKVRFYEPSGNNILDAEENGKLSVEISNIGKGPAFNLTIILKKLKGSRYLSFQPEKTIPSIYPGKHINIDFPLKADYRIGSDKNRILIEFKEQFGFQPDPITVEFLTHKEEPPHLYVKKIKIDDDSRGKSFGDNDQQIELGETIEVTVTIGNKGTGTAQNVRAEIISQHVKYLFLGDNTKFNLGNIEPNMDKSFTFIFSTNKLYRGNNILPLKINILEKRSRYNLLNKSLELRLNTFIGGGQFVAFSPSEVEQDKINIDDVSFNLVKKNPYGVAVIIGNMHYQKQGVPEVKYAARDASLMRQYINKLFGFPKENIIFIEDGTKADFDQIFGTPNNYSGKLFNYITPNKSDVFIYYTGHGAPDVENHEGYFVPVDCDPTYVKLTGYPLNQFYKNLSMLKAKKIVTVIDACFSGQSNDGFILDNISPIYIQVKTPIIMIPNFILFTSSSAEQVSHWYPQKQHSLFTYLFLKKIKESYSINHKEITAGELFDYLQREVNRLSRKIYGRDQQPTFWGKRDAYLFK